MKNYKQTLAVSGTKQQKTFTYTSREQLKSRVEQWLYDLEEKGHIQSVDRVNLKMVLPKKYRA